MAVRRSPDFKFDYYLRTLPTDLIGKRCDQLMKAAEKEVEQMMKKFRSENGNVDDSLSHTQLPKFKVMKEMQRKQEEEAIEAERRQIEGKVEGIENHMEEIENRLKFLQKCSKQFEGTTSRRTTYQHSEFPEEMLPDLANLVATSGSTGVMSIANDFISQHGQVCAKKILCMKIEDIAKKERRKEDGDVRAVWHILPEYKNLLSVKTIRNLRREKDSRMNKKRGNTKRKKDEKEGANDNADTSKGAMGPDGDFVEFPPYDGTEEPRECKKAFTLFCTGNRKEVKRSLDPASRKDRVSVVI